MKKPRQGLVLLSLLWTASMGAAAHSFQGYRHNELPVHELAASLPFYRNIVGLPRVAVPGTLASSQGWFDLGEGQRLWLVERRTGAGTWRASGLHLAVEVNSLQQTEQQLKQRSAAVTRQVDPTGQPMLQLTDPDGYLIDLYEERGNKKGVLQSAGKLLWKSITSVD